MGDKKLTIWQVSLLEETYYGTPGQVARISPDGVIVICGDNKAILLEILQLQNDKRAVASAVIKTHSTRFNFGGM